MDVAIVGAGLSGLACAQRLTASGIKTAVFEASPRTGGRIGYCTTKASGDYLGDTGPSWCWPVFQPVLKGWLNELTIDTLPINAAGTGLIDQGPSHKPVRYDIPAQAGMMRLAGGPQAIINDLLQKLQNIQIHTGCKVIGLSGPASQTENDSIAETIEVQVKTSDGQESSITAKVVVIATPLRLAAETIQFPASLDSIVPLLRDTPTWMATQSKIILEYETPFWRNFQLSGRMISRSGPIMELHDHSGRDGYPAALTGFLSRPPGTPQDDNHTQAILAQLERCYGASARDPRTMHIEEWSKNDLICSHRDRQDSNPHPDIRPDALRDPLLSGRLHFATSESSDISPGLMEGALHRANTVAATIINKLGNK